MKKQKVFSAARRGSKRVKGISREVRVLNLQAAYGICEDAMSTLMVMANPHKHAHLFYKVCNSLRGFDPHIFSASAHLPLQSDANIIILRKRV